MVAVPVTEPKKAREKLMCWLKGHWHDIWQLYKKTEGVLASTEFQN